MINSIRFRRTAVLIGFLCGAVSPVGTQARTRISLERPEWTSDVAFTQVSAIRELQDGSVLIADPGENRIVHLSGSGVEISQVGRAGQGPGEYQAVRDIFSLSRDSTLFIDAFSLRWSILAGAFFASTGAPNTLAGEVRGADTVGRVMLMQPSRGRDGATPGILETADSVAVLLVNRRTGTREIVAVVKGRGRGGFSMQPARGNSNGTLVVSQPLSVEDAAILLADGAIAIVRSENYRIDVRLPDGRWQRGAPLPFESVPMNADERCFAKRRMFHPTFPCSDAPEPGWPEVVPPFVPRTKNLPFPVVLADDRGRILVARAPHRASTKQLYDVVGRDGRLLTTLELSLGEAIVGAGRGTIYSVVTDQDGLRRIRRHAWP